MQDPCCDPTPARFDPEASQRLADRFKALGDPARVALIGKLAGSDEVCVCDLVAGSRLSQPTISHHLGILRRAGLVTSRRKGTWAYYRLEPDALRDLSAMLGGLATPAAGVAAA